LVHLNISLSQRTIALRKIEPACLTHRSVMALRRPNELGVTRGIGSFVRSALPFLEFLAVNLLVRLYTGTPYEQVNSLKKSFIVRVPGRIENVALSNE